MQSQKWQNDLCSFPRQTIQYHSNPNLWPNQWCWKSWSWMVLWRLTRLEQALKKDVLFIKGDWNAKVGSQEIPGVIGKFGFGVQNEAGQRLIEFSQENMLVKSKHPLLTTQEMTLHMDITDSQYWDQTDYILCSQRWRSSIHTVSKNKNRSWLWLRSWTSYCQIQTYTEESRENH